MKTVDEAGGVKVGDRVHFWVSHPSHEAPNWQEGRVNRILQIADDYLLEINSFTPKPIYRFLSELKPKDLYVA